MGIYALIPVQEALHVDHIADLEILYSGIYIRGIVAQIGLDGEGVGLSVIGNVEVQIVAVRAGAVPVVQERHVVSVRILAGGFYGHSGEGYEFILMVDQLVGAEHCGHIQRLRNEGVSAFHKFKGTVHDLHFSGPLSLVAGDADLGSGNQLGGVLFGAGQVIEEISAVLILRVNGDGILPPGLGRLYIGFHSNLGVQLGGHVLVIAQHRSGTFRSRLRGGFRFGFRSFRAFGRSAFLSRCGAFNGSAFRRRLCGAASCASCQSGYHGKSQNQR